MLTILVTTVDNYEGPDHPKGQLLLTLCIKQTFFHREAREKPLPTEWLKDCCESNAERTLYKLSELTEKEGKNVLCSYKNRISGLNSKDYYLEMSSYNASPGWPYPWFETRLGQHHAVMSWMTIVNIFGELTTITYREIFKRLYIRTRKPTRPWPKGSNLLLSSTGESFLCNFLVFPSHKNLCDVRERMFSESLFIITSTIEQNMVNKTSTITTICFFNEIFTSNLQY